MKRLHSLLVLSALLPLGLAAAPGCAVDSPPTADDELSRSDAAPTLEEILASDGKTDHWDDIEVCHAVCKATRPHDGGCWNQVACAEFCGSYATSLRDEALTAYASCAVENPLCYQTMESCMWARIFDEPFEQHVQVHGAGFDDGEGATVHAAFRDRENTAYFWAEAAVNQGGFTLEWDVTHQAVGHLVLYFVDLDGDGSCTPGTDITGSEHVGVAGDWLDPTFDAWIQPDSTSNNGWQCQYLNEAAP